MQRPYWPGWAPPRVHRPLWSPDVRLRVEQHASLREWSAICEDARVDRVSALVGKLPYYAVGGGTSPAAAVTSLLTHLGEQARRW